MFVFVLNLSEQFDQVFIAWNFISNELIRKSIEISSIEFIDRLFVIFLNSTKHLLKSLS